MKTFDYSTLSQPITYKEARAEVKEVPGRYKNAMFVIALLILIFGFNILLIGAVDNLFIILLPLLFVAGFAAFYYRRFRKEVINLAQVQRFAKANDMITVANSGEFTGYPGSLFNDGHSRSIIMSVRTKEPKDMMEVGNYRYVIGSGKNSHEYFFTYMLIRLDRKVPHIYIDSKGNNSWGNRNHAGDFARSQKFELEGDFNKYFTVYAPSEYESDALYILTPDVMHSLVTYGQDFDFELIDDTLIMFKHGVVALGESNNLETLLSKAMEFAEEFRQQTKRYADDRVANAAANTVAVKGQRLKSGFPWVIVFIVAYFLFNIITSILSN